MIPGISLSGRNTRKTKNGINGKTLSKVHLHLNGFEASSDVCHLSYSLIKELLKGKEDQAR